MNVEQKRQALCGAYRNSKWWTRVKNMPEDQVVAVYYRLKQQNRV